MAEDNHPDRTLTTNTSVRSDLVVAQPQERPSSTHDSETFHDVLHSNSTQVNTPESTRTANLQQPNLQNPSPTKAAPPPIAQPQVKKSFVDAVTSQSSPASFPKGPFTVTMITNRHVLINLENEADYTKLWIQRLWHIDGFPVRTFKWTPSFRPQHESSLAPVWIRFPTLPAHLFHKDALHAIASLVGTPLKLDESTLFQSRLTAVRVCVEVDLAKKLIEEIVIGIGNEEVVQKVIFENLPKYCLLCKHAGHDARNCYTKGNAPKPQSNKNQQGINNADATGIENNNQFKEIRTQEPTTSRYHTEASNNCLQVVTVPENSTDPQPSVIMDGKLESPAPLTRYQPEFNTSDANVTVQRVFDISALNLNDLNVENVNDHCEGVAMVAPLQCDLVPITPTPIVETGDNN
ncbi:UNVERIFIED_CONTAM: hypothetical protein Scaly_1031300 [Sesamum calycinum]|uniref:DUF4283 domain-containing protein n=1 Tax=Sesamum calycinum TaxID=2727403 RepID=A0AAW2QKD2_9LAMI